MAVALPGRLAGQPVLILREGATRQRGRDVQRANLAAAMIVAEVVKATLGPRGMDKMLVDTLGDVTITNDGHEILKEMDIQHPAAKMIVEVAETQDDIVGDGTTTAVVLAGALLKRAGDLLDKKIHPTMIVSGYRKAADMAIQSLRDVSVEIDIGDRETLRKVAVTAMYGKIVGMARSHFSDLAIDAVMQVTERRPSGLFADRDDIQIVKKTGKSLFDSRLIRGIIIDKEVVRPDMPQRVEDAKIALLDCPMEIEKTEFDAEIRIRDPNTMKAFLEEESRILRGMVDNIAATGANVVLCQRGIDDMAQHYLAKEGILAVRRIKASDMEKLAKATGAKVVTNLEDLRAEDLGTAALVEERKIGEDELVFVEGCKSPKAVAILIRAGLERLIDEAERSISDAINVIIDVVKENRIVAGGGAIEEVLAKGLRDYASKVGGREQLAIEAFADSLEEIPLTLADNAGLDPIDIIVELRAAHEKADGLWTGVDAFTGKVTDMMRQGVIEPLSVKEQAIKSAVEASSMILRIDDVIAAAKPPPMPPGKYPGAEGMPPGY